MRFDNGAAAGWFTRMSRQRTGTCCKSSPFRRAAPSHFSPFYGPDFASFFRFGEVRAFYLCPGDDNPGRQERSFPTSPQASRVVLVILRFSPLGIKWNLDDTSFLFAAGLPGTYSFRDTAKAQRNLFLWPGLICPVLSTLFVTWFPSSSLNRISAVYTLTGLQRDKCLIWTTILAHPPHRTIWLATKVGASFPFVTYPPPGSWPSPHLFFFSKLP